MRSLLLPFSWLFGLVLRIRHWLYDNGLKPSWEPPVKTIVVGNLRVGGSGKTPMILHLGNWLIAKHKPAFLSRGYGRKSKGFKWVEQGMDASLTGDEPLLFKQAFPEAPVAVDANRKNGISRILNERPDVKLVLLDDAFQHRKVKPGFSILMMPFADFRKSRFLLPAGNERDLGSRRLKADVIVVSKVPANLSQADKEKVLSNLHPFPPQQVYFSTIEYDDLLSFDGSTRITLQQASDEPFVLVTGLAGDGGLAQKLAGGKGQHDHFRFADHHAYTAEDVAQIEAKRCMFAPHAKVLCTAKDRVKLHSLVDPKLQPFWFEIPIHYRFDREDDLKKRIYAYVEGNTTNR